MNLFKKWLAVSMIAASAITTVGAEESAFKNETPLEVYRAGSQKPFEGNANVFTGKVKVDMLFPANDTAHYSGAYVTFQLGARTAWHSHPAGQHIIVTSGKGLTGTRNGTVVEFKEGDVVWCPVDTDHWHGATPNSGMTHLVVTGVLDGKNVVWKDKVTDEQYRAKPAR